PVRRDYTPEQVADMVALLPMSAFARKMDHADRNDQPRMLYLAWFGREIDDGTLREWILPTWEMAEFPARLGQRVWIEMFAATGFVTDGGDDPPSPLTVYRGAALSRMRGFSWTWEIERARWFAHRTACFGFAAGVFTVTLEPEMLLAVASGVEGRGEREVLVNPNRLRGRFTPQLIEKTTT
ncbi:MAG: hypothetical protein M3R39_04140, partial [Actinomycetota bacterium]|nr:hypothetical protein [Actinomycetota bacterium]